MMDAYKTAPYIKEAIGLLLNFAIVATSREQNPHLL
jgi:hypothetical protein